MTRFAVWVVMATLVAFGLADVRGERERREEPYVRPEFARTMERLRPQILAAAARHNRPEISGMTDTEFAQVIALLLYNEHFGWLEDEVPPLRALTPLYQAAQIEINRRGGNLSVWPSNLRPSVALEIMRHEVPLRDGVVKHALRVAGSELAIESYSSERERYVAITDEITRPELAVEFLAANLERGLYRARHERVAVSWRTLAAWHNQGIVAPADIRRNATARDYIRRTAAYLPVVEALVAASEPRRPPAAGPTAE